MNIADEMTLMRAFLTIPLVAFILQNRTIEIFIILVLAALTELDGTVARLTKQASTFGSVFDPTVDSLFCLGGIIALLIIDKLSLFLMGILLVPILVKVVFVWLRFRKDKIVNSTLICKFAGVTIAGIIPLAVIDFAYINHYVVLVIIFTIIIALKKIIEFYRIK